MGGDQRYIEKQAQIASTTDSQAIKDDCMYRIYTNSEPDDKNFPVDGTLSSSQRKIAEQLVQEALKNSGSAN